MTDTAKQASTPIVYSTTWCGYCKMLKKYLDDKKIVYIEKNIEADEDAYRELEAKMGGQFRGVPVSDFGGKIILGFDRPAVDEAIKSLS